MRQHFQLNTILNDFSGFLQIMVQPIDQSPCSRLYSEYKTWWSSPSLSLSLSHIRSIFTAIRRSPHSCDDFDTRNKKTEEKNCNFSMHGLPWILQIHFILRLHTKSEYVFSILSNGNILMDSTQHRPREKKNKKEITKLCTSVVWCGVALLSSCVCHFDKSHEQQRNRVDGRPRCWPNEHTTYYFIEPLVVKLADILDTTHFVSGLMLMLM